MILRCGRVELAVLGRCAVGLAGSIHRRTARDPGKIKSEDRMDGRGEHGTG